MADEIFCCTGCGKETRSKDRICFRCQLGTQVQGLGGSEHRGRSARSSQVIGGAPKIPENDELDGSQLPNRTPGEKKGKWWELPAVPSTIQENRLPIDGIVVQSLDGVKAHRRSK